VLLAPDGFSHTEIAEGVTASWPDGDQPAGSLRADPRYGHNAEPSNGLGPPGKVAG
jgi:hypothetical protein